MADALALPPEDGSVTGCRADKLLHALPEPEQAVVEARRVLAARGRAVLIGQDWDTLVVDSDAPEFTRGLVRTRADNMPSPRVARRYRNLLLDNGFTDVTVAGAHDRPHGRGGPADARQRRGRRPLARRATSEKSSAAT
ncbi:methyltransferase domain-containing protein [Nocardia thraciensis]